MEHKENKNKNGQWGKKLFVYPMLVLLFAGSMWLIFAPADSDNEQEQGFNTDVPSPTNGAMMDDKQEAYEQETMAAKEKARQQQMQDLASMFGTEDEQQVMPSDDEPQTDDGSRPRETIYASANAYQDINRTLGNFYEEPKVDPEKEDMQKRIDELTTMVNAGQQTKIGLDEQVALMEKSYQLAAKYLPSDKQPTVEQKAPETVKNGKALVNPIGQVHASVVTTLGPPISDSAFVADYSKERNMDFHTAVGATGQTDKNTIRACIHDNQTITDGQAIRMRLLEPMRAGATILPRNAIVTGMGKIQGDRLGIDIMTLEYAGTIIPVELLVFDSDGQEGIFIPNSMEVSAVKEVAANMGSSLGTSVSITNQGAGDELLSELGKGVIQGASQYISKKMREVKVHLKAGYQVNLYQPKN